MLQWLVDHWTVIATAGSGFFAAVATVDHYLAKTKSIIQNSVGPFVWALITRKPIRAQAKGEGIMSFLDELEGFISKAEALLDRGLPVLDKMAQFVEKAAPMAQAIAPFTGGSAPAVTAAAAAANAIATATDHAIQNHLAAGGTHQSNLTAVAAIAQSVATSGLVPADTAAKITSIADTVNAYQMQG